MIEMPRWMGRLLSAAALALSLGVQAAPVVSLQPSTGTHTVGDTFSVELLGTGLIDVYAFQFALNFTSGVLGVSGVSEGDALSSVNTTFFVPGAADNGAGTLELSGNTLIGAVSGFSGDGWLATIDFQALGVGVGSVQLTDVLFLDSLLNIIDVTSQDARFVIESAGGTVSLPSSFSLVALGLCAALALSRRRASFWR